MADEVLGRMVIELGLKDSAFSKGITGANKMVRSSMAEMKASMAVVGQAGSKYDLLATKQRGLTKVLEAQKAQMELLRKSYQGSLTETGQATKKTADYARQFNNASAKVSALNSQLIANAKAMAAARVETTGFTGKLNAFGKSAQTVGDKMKSIGDSATMKLTAPIALGFGYAIKKSIDLQNEMVTIKNLLVTGGESASEAISGVKQMQKDALTYSNKYGVSQQEIAKGYTELVKRGYTSKQALGAMKSELEASKASGDDFSDVVTVASQTLESFGMKAKTTAGMTKNTKTVVNDLAYAADMTSTNFSDLGVGMSYVGSTAHQAGFSLSETASAMGILSNNGLEADKAGTGLRKAINSLVSPTDAATGALKDMGLSTKDFVGQNGKMKSMSTIFGMLNDHMKGLSDVKKQDIFHTIFGTTGQQAGIILAENAKQLSELNKKVADSAKNNYVQSLAEKNMKSAQNQLKILKESLTNLGITAANDVLPAIQPVIKDVTKLVQKFGDLDSGTQKNIVKAALLAAAFGPVVSILGRTVSMTGKLASGTVSIASWIAQMSAGKTAMKEFGTASKIASIGTETIATGATGATGALSLLNPWVLGIAGTVAVGALAWESFGKKMYDSSQRTQRWGADVGSSADQAATKFKDYSTKASVALSDTASSAKTNGKQIESAFKRMAKSAEDAAKKQKTAAEKFAESVGGSAGAAIEAEAEKEDKNNQTHISKIKKYYNQVQTITKQARDNNVALTEDQRSQLYNLQQKMAQEQVKVLGLSAKNQRLVLKAELNQTNNMTTSQLTSMANAASEAANKELDNYNTTYGKIKSSTVLTTKEKNKALEALETEHNNAMNQLGIAYINAERAKGYNEKAILQDMQDSYGWTAKQAQSAYDAFNTAQKKTSATVIKVSDDMKKGVADAANKWNNLVFDKKTGTLKTNAQEEVTKALQSTKGWNNIQLLEKKGLMSTNANAMVAQGLIANKDWNNLNWLVKHAKLNDDTKVATMSALVSANQWNTKDWKTAKMLATDNTNSSVISALNSMGRWQNLTPKQQQMIAQAQTGPALTKALQDIGVWNSLSPREKNLIANDKASGVASAAGRALQYYYDHSPDKKTTLTTEYISIHKDYAQAVGGKQLQVNAKGTNNHPGGPMMVNDQKGSNYQELVSLPNGNSFIPQGRNVIFDAPRGTKVLKASLTEKLMSAFPKYATGVGIPSNAKILSSAIDVTNRLNANRKNSNNVTSIDMSGVESKLDLVAKLLLTLTQKDTTLNIDGKAIAKTVSDMQMNTVNLAGRRVFTNG
ncbi:MAG: phage tail tape measure protein [Liquorilactobacillus hordei]|uniref:phage tail tape measure protein n=1 Tax=Liquorilactobacillus hordei TaxID=468911 RepID=UPI0039ECF2CD